MDKKNTMLLTVIAVATLLVAVVGATFAYFSVTGDQSATTNVTAKTGKIGTVAVNKGTGTYNLVLTAQDMAKNAEDSNISYYAINGTTSNGGTDTGGKWSKSPVGLEIATITLTGANQNDKVSCDISIQATLSGDMVSLLQKGDAFITLKSDNYDGFSGVESLDLKDDTSLNKFTYESSSATATFTGAGKLELNGESDSKTVKADIWIVNKYDKEQNYLAGKDLTVQLTTQVSNCSTTSTAGE